MQRVRPLLWLLIPAMFAVSACSDSPTAPTSAKLAPTAPEPSIITPLLLPPGAEWGLYFTSFNPDRHLAVRVIHYPNTGDAATGDGAFVIPLGGRRKIAGVLQVQTAQGYGGCVPEGSSCDPTVNTYPVMIPEGAIVTGKAFVNGTWTGFRLDLHSNFWPQAAPPYVFDTATIQFCSDPADTGTCGPAYSFYGELHHEPT